MVLLAIYDDDFMMMMMIRAIVLCCAVALELMDQGVTMWQPTPRKSSCSSCSQNGSSDGSLPNGCNQERQVLPKDGLKSQFRLFPSK